MSMTTKQKKAFAAWATATAALGLLTGPALAQATPMASTGCTQYLFMGKFAFNQSNGFSVSFPGNGTKTAYGPATAWPDGDTGFASGRIEGRQIHFEIRWPSANNYAGATGSYSGFVDDNGFAHGHTREVGPEISASWDSTVPLGCVTHAAPSTPLPGTDQKPNHPVPVTPPPLPGTDQKPNHPVPVTAPPTPLPGTDRKPNFPVP